MIEAFVSGMLAVSGSSLENKLKCHVPLFSISFFSISFCFVSYPFLIGEKDPSFIDKRRKRPESTRCSDQEWRRKIKKKRVEETNLIETGTMVYDPVRCGVKKLTRLVDIDWIPVLLNEGIKLVHQPQRRWTNRYYHKRKIQHIQDEDTYPIHSFEVGSFKKEIFLKMVMVVLLFFCVPVIVLFVWEYRTLNTSGCLESIRPYSRQQKKHGSVRTYIKHLTT